LKKILKDSIKISPLIILWTIYGMVSGHVFTLQFGCFIVPESAYFSFLIIFGAISIFLIGVVFLIKSESLKAKLFIFECFIWLFIFFSLKGGFAIGYLGIPDLFVTLFDLIAILMRLINLSRFYPSFILLTHGKRRLGLLIIPLLIILLKSISFPSPIIDLL